MISVVVPTYRVGGLDVLCESLRLQTYQDFELIVADELHAWRADTLARRFANYPFPILHLAPGSGPRFSNYSTSINNAIVRARGETVVIMPDYTWLERDCLETHTRAQVEIPMACVMLDYLYVGLPPLLAGDGFAYSPRLRSPEVQESISSPEFMGAINEAATAYEGALGSGWFDPLMWSLFHEPVTEEVVMSLPVTYTHTKQNPGGPLYQPPDRQPDWCSLKNESIPTEAFLQVNGLDQDLDGSHVYQDQEFAHRCANHGYRWTTVPGGQARVLDPRTLIHAKRILRPMTENGDIMRAKRAGLPINPGRDLRAERARNLGLS